MSKPVDSPVDLPVDLPVDAATPPARHAQQSQGGVDTTLLSSLRAAWPVRRRLAALGLLPAVATWFVVAGRATDLPVSTAWYALVGLASVLGAAVLASYVPVVGRRPDLGCTPCATMSALTVVGATMALRNYGVDIAGPLVAAGLLLFGLTQRMSQPATCPTPGQRRP